MTTTTDNIASTDEKPTHINVSPSIIGQNTQYLLGRAEVISTELKVATSQVRQATIDRHGIETLLNSAKTRLQVRRDEILLANADDIKKLGSNEEIREAKLRSMLKAENDKVVAHTESLYELNHQLNLANLQLEQATRELRVLESISRIIAGA